MKVEVVLEGMEFYAFHGFYAEERRIGNKFSVDVKTEIEVEEGKDMDELSNTVNYEEVYSIVKIHMSEPSKLLENVVSKILQDIFKKWPEVKFASVKLSKYNPPVGGVCNKAVVTLTRSR
jgi:dihydroneopterin aldolase